MRLSLKKYLLLFAFSLFFVPGSVKAESLSFITPNYPVVPEIATGSPAINLSWQQQALGPVYSYKFVSDRIFDPSWPLTIKINYDKVDNNLKQIYAYDELGNSWLPLETKDFPQEKYATALTTSLTGRLALFSNRNILTVGSASWYKYKNGNFAASPDFAKGSIIRVYNLSNNKFVDVTINDWGPDRARHPDRVIDLDKAAFEKIASTGDGLVRVRIEPLKIVGSPLAKKLEQPSAEPVITASGAIIMKEKNLQVLWEKNSKEISPLASLTKLAALKVFFDLKPDLNKIVAYKTQDEKYNNEYAKPGEAARLKLKAGETLKIKDLVYASLVSSQNNAVESLVRVSGLSRADFIARMNKFAAKIGATSTNFIEPTGLSPENVSSPYDYAIITKEALKNPLLQKISTTASYKFKTINTKKEFRLANTNKLVQAGTYPLSGSKTGYLDEAGYCLMTRVKTAQGNLIVVNFNSKNRAESFLDNEQLIRYGTYQLAK